MMMMVSSVATPGLLPIMVAAYTVVVPSFFSRASPMAEYAVEPGARVVWRLRRRATDVRCVVLPASMPVEVHVVHGDDIVLTEVFQEEWMAMNWARAYRDRLRAQGWGDVQGSPGV